MTNTSGKSINAIDTVKVWNRLPVFHFSRDHDDTFWQRKRSRKKHIWNWHFKTISAWGNKLASLKQSKVQMSFGSGTNTQLALIFASPVGEGRQPWPPVLLLQLGAVRTHRLEADGRLHLVQLLWFLWVLKMFCFSSKRLIHFPQNCQKVELPFFLNTPMGDEASLMAASAQSDCPLHVCLGCVLYIGGRECSCNDCTMLCSLFFA